MFGAFVEGWRRLWRAPGLAISITLAMTLMSVPLAMRPGDLIGLDVQSTIRSALFMANRAWATEQFLSSSAPAPAAFYAILGVGGTVAAAYILLWVFLAGGILDRLARGRPVGTAQFFGSCGVYLLRFVRLGLVVVAFYVVLFRVLRPQISNRGELLVFLAALAVVNLIADFAKVRLVVEDRRSAIGALLAALRFIRQRPVQTVGLYSLNVLTAMGLALLGQRLYPGVFLSMQSAWLVFLVTLAYLFVRIATRLAFVASEVAFFQRQLAHADYTAAPEIVWPDSPAVEAIQNLTSRKEPKREGREGYEGREGSSW